MSSESNINPYVLGVEGLVVTFQGAICLVIVA
jgi:hypothetical protein